MQERHSILKKLQDIHSEHGSEMSPVLGDMSAVVDHLPAEEYAKESAPLVEELDRIGGGRRRGPQPLAEVLPEVLGRLGVWVVESSKSGE